MSEKALTVKITKSQRDEFHKHLGYMRCWVQGFEAAGKRGPHSVDVLRQIQVLLGDAK